MTFRTFITTRCCQNNCFEVLRQFGGGVGAGDACHILMIGLTQVELLVMDVGELAENCRKAFWKYVTVTRQRPAPTDRQVADHKPSPLRPNQQKYWDKRGDKTLGIGHVFKYPYSYYDLLRRADDPELTATFNEKAYHLF